MNEHEKQFHLPDSGFDKVLGNITKAPEVKKEKRLITYEESLELAKDLLNRHKNEILGQKDKDVDGWGTPYTDHQKSIRHFIDKTPQDILERFVGHGITKKGEIDRLAAALNILANKSIQGSCGQLAGNIGGYNAYKDGDFIVISKLDTNFRIMQELDGRLQPELNEIGLLVNIGAFVVDTKYYSMVEELKTMFPDVNMIKANELPEYLKV